MVFPAEFPPRTFPNRISHKESSMRSLFLRFLCFRYSRRFRSSSRISMTTMLFTFSLVDMASAQAPPQQYVYASVPLTAATSEVAAFSKDSATGALTPLVSAPATDRLEGGAMAVDALGRFLFVLNPYTSYISMFQIDSKSGALAEVHVSLFFAATTENPN